MWGVTRIGMGASLAAWLALFAAVLPAPASAQEPAAEPPIRRGAAPAVPGAAIPLDLAAGEVLSAGTCGLPGAVARGDTTLRLDAPDGQLAAENDDACGGLGSYLDYRAPIAGRYSLVSGCYGGSSCDGTVAWEIGPRPATPQLPPYIPLRVMTSARGLVAFDRAGGGLMLDAIVEARLDGLFLVRAAGAPMAVAGGALGGIAAGSASLVVGLSVDWIELGLGAGAAVLATRLGNPGTKEAATFVVHARIGRLGMFHVEGQLTMASFDDAMEIVNVQGVVRLPLRGFDLGLRGVGGHDGVALGELGAVIWVVSSAERPLFGVSVHAGGGGVFYQPVCRFGAGCADARWYAGFVAGAGVEWRP